MSSTAFIEPLPVIDFVAQLLNREVQARPLSDADRVKVFFWAFIFCLFCNYALLLLFFDVQRHLKIKSLGFCKIFAGCFIIVTWKQSLCFPPIRVDWTWTFWYSNLCWYCFCLLSEEVLQYFESLFVINLFNFVDFNYINN